MRAVHARALCCVAAAILATSSTPARAEDAAPVAIVHGRVYVPGDHPPVDDATVVLSGGKVQTVGSGVQPPPGAKVIDARGRIVTPGFIDADDDVGVVDIDMEAPTNDADAHLALDPALRLADAYNPRSVLVPITRSAGITSIVLAPRSGVLAGQGAFVDLVEDDVPGAVVRSPVASYANVDEDTAQAAAGNRGSLWLMLREAFDDARFYGTHRAQYESNASRPLGLHRLALEALQPVVRGTLPLVVTAHRASDIETALRVADELKLRIVLRGASEAWMIADELARRKVAVIVDPLEDLPSQFDRLHARSDNAAILSRAGVRVIIATFATHQARRLWQHAGNAVRLGMDHDAAIRAITEAPAAAFDMQGYGKLEAGAVGNVVVWSGDPFQTSTHVEHVFVRGREASLENRQTLLLRRYRKLPFLHDGSR